MVSAGSKEGVPGQSKSEIIEPRMKHESNKDGTKLECWSMGVMAEKWTGFSRIETALTRLFPHKSTQVVDFPRMAMVSIFWGRGIHRRGGETPSQIRQRDEHGKWSIGGRLGEGFVGKWLCSITRIYTHLHDFTQSSYSVTLRALRPSVWRVRWAGFAHLNRLCGVTGRGGLHKFAKVRVV
jgi:hypothetical protein